MAALNPEPSLTLQQCINTRLHLKLFLQMQTVSKGSNRVLLQMALQHTLSSSPFAYSQYATLVLNHFAFVFTFVFVSIFVFVLVFFACSPTLFNPGHCWPVGPPKQFVFVAAAGPSLATLLQVFNAPAVNTQRCKVTFMFQVQEQL